MIRAWVTVFSLIWSISAYAEEPLTASRLGIITTKGYVTFFVPDNCKILSLQSKPPISVMACQVKNPADAGRPDSTNIAISLYHIDYEAGKTGLALAGKQYGPDRPRMRSVDGWTVFEQNARQNNTPYTILDAKKPVADVVVGIRLAWPHLLNNASDYDRKMQYIFNFLMHNVSGGLGKMPKDEGTTFYRPQ
jgi:hypothetical protein